MCLHVDRLLRIANNFFFGRLVDKWYRNFSMARLQWKNRLFGRSTQGNSSVQWNSTAAEIPNSGWKEKLQLKTMAGKRVGIADSKDWNSCDSTALNMNWGSRREVF